MTPPPQKPSELGQTIQEITELSQKLIREEIELAKAEVAQSVTKLAKGAAVGVAAGVFILFGVIYLFEGFAWLIWQQTDTQSSYWLGFAIMALILFVLAALAGFLAYKFVKAGSSPAPKMAIEEAQKVKQTLGSGVKS